MKKMSRKTFLIGGTTAVAAVVTGVCACRKTVWATISGKGTTPLIASEAYEVLDDQRVRIHLGSVPELVRVGGAVKIIDSRLDDSLIVARIAEDAYVAASIHCTHRGVEVEYKEEEKCFKCASIGGSRFATNGEKTRGFAKGPLRTYALTSEGDDLVIRLS